MKERPILMTTESVKAILDGRKTQTRRVIKDPRRPSRERDAFLSMSPGKPDIGDIGRDLKLSKNIKPNFPCPYGQVGDRLWVRETWRPAWAVNLGGISGPGIQYKSDMVIYGRVEAGKEHPECQFHPKKWHQAIFMPHWASRLTLEITGVRVERLQEITHDDCIREGIVPKIPDWHFKTLADYIEYVKTQYAILWDSLNAKRGYGWDKNPWVWVIGLRRID